MRILRVGDQRDAGGPEARVFLGARNLPAELRRELAVDGRDMHADLFEDAAVHHRHDAAAARRAAVVGALPTACGRSGPARAPRKARCPEARPRSSRRRRRSRREAPRTTAAARLSSSRPPAAEAAAGFFFAISLSSDRRLDHRAGGGKRSFLAFLSREPSPAGPRFPLYAGILRRRNGMVLACDSSPLFRRASWPLGMVRRAWRDHDHRRFHRPDERRYGDGRQRPDRRRDDDRVRHHGDHPWIPDEALEPLLPVDPHRRALRDRGVA